MNELTGGVQCPKCGFNFELGDSEASPYHCFGMVNGEVVSESIQGLSIDAALVTFKVNHPGVVDAMCVEEYGSYGH